MNRSRMAGGAGEALAWHVTMRLRVDRVLARTAAEFRAGSRAIVARGAGRGLLAHRIVDTHVHALVATPREDAGTFARLAESSMCHALALDSGFEPARFTAVRDLRHLYRTFAYVLRQADRHGATLDRAHEGSLLPDLLGMRCIDAGAAERVMRALPRVHAEELAPLFRVEDVVGAPILAMHLSEAAAAALALPDLDGRDPVRVLARRAAALAGAELPAADVADALGVTRRTVFDLRASGHVPAELLRAVVLQAKLRARLGAEVSPVSWWERDA